MSAKSRECFVVTWQSPSGATIDLSEFQRAELDRLGLWPKDPTGMEFCQVRYGQHWGEPATFEELKRLTRGLS